MIENFLERDRSTETPEYGFMIAVNSFIGVVELAGNTTVGQNAIGSMSSDTRKRAVDAANKFLELESNTK